MIPESFTLEETPQERSENAPDVPRSLRSEWNVRDADATLILTSQAKPKDAGTRWTMKAAEIYHKPLLLLDPGLKVSEKLLTDWLKAKAVRTLNVAGPAESTEEGIGDIVFAFLRLSLLSHQEKY
ncbi:hypothetical protein OKW21_003986 [Catalinimonas alkaloidigena]|nr:hypothetical protein [Catalinimonas alkaloidigena]